MGFGKLMRAAVKPWLFVLVAAALAAAALVAPQIARGAELWEVRFGVSSPRVTRVVFDLSSPVAYTISGDLQGEGRLIVDFQGLAAGGPEKAGSGAGLVGSYRLTTNSGKTQVILAFAKTAKVKEHFILPSKSAGEKTRLVIDLAATTKADFEASLASKYEDIAEVIEAVTAPAPVAAAPASLRPPIIVIDAGHGGIDPGTSGPAGTAEKTVTLAAAQTLAEILRSKGRYRIVMTRASDVRITLEDRLKTAREASADLFISLHADAHKDPTLRGGSVYTLSEAGSQRSTREALTQGDYHVFDLDIKAERADLQPILLDVAQRHTNGQSAQFADFLIQQLSGATPLINNTHRTADLKVLLSPDVAAVLLELAFISNARDEANLNSAAWRQKTMTAVATAIDQYFAARGAGKPPLGGAEGAN